MSKIIVGVLV